jgi:beta-glucuronidase
MGGRAVEDLSGPWTFAPDLFDEGLRQRWFADEPSDPSGWTHPRDYDGDPQRTIDVPSTWTCVRPEWRHFEGGAWYTRSVSAPAEAGLRIVLRVGAASYEARVFLNGVFLGSHRGASTPFFVELTEHLRPGDNRLQIHVDNRRRADRVPMHHFDWFNDGGLYREVGLLRLPAVFIREARFGLVPNGTFSDIRADIVLSDPVDGEALVQLPGLGCMVVVPIVGGRGARVFRAHPDLWEPGRPILYDVETRFGADAVRERIGFREIRRDGGEILLNGRPLWLKGLCVHEDDAVRGKVSTQADVRRRIAHAKELNCNALRLAHYPHHEHVAALADEAGLLLWSEIPVYWAIDFDNPETFQDARNQLRELVARDFNRASVVIWGVGNENADTDARYRFMAGLADEARRLDPTRLVSAACLINRAAFRIEDRLAEHLDVIGLNEYFGWYEPDFDGLERLIANSAPDRPVVISEFGADAVAGLRGGERELFTEDCQAAILRRQFEILQTAPWLRGTFPWLLYDFRSERRQTRHQRGWNRKGLIAEDKTTKKLGFDVLRQTYDSWFSGKGSD